MDELFKEQVKKGFNSCKSDITLLNTEKEQLKEKLYLLEIENKNLKNELSKTNETALELKTQLTEIRYALEALKVAPITTTAQPIQTPKPKIQKLEEQEELPQIKIQKEEKPQNTYDALLAFKAKKNKRDMLKQKLKSIIGENGITLSELKFMFVEHFKYCSKASFYNYLKELELERTIRIERQNTHNIVSLQQNYN